MNTEFRMRGMAAACALALGFSGMATAQTSNQNAVVAQPPAAAGAAIADKTDAIAQINEATRVIREMNREPEASQLLQEAQGVFIVTRYARAGFGVGVRGGEGTLLVKQNGSWSNPAFYNFGGVSGGLQAGAEAGSLVMVLNSEKAVQSFMQENNWSLNADAGLTIVAWSERAKGEVGMGDIVVWSNTGGLMGDLAVSVTDIFFDEEETGAFYGRQIALRDIFNADMGQLPHVANLKQALPGGAEQSTGGGGAPDAIITVVPVVPAEQGENSQGSSVQGGASQGQGGATQDGTSGSGDSGSGNAGTSGGNTEQLQDRPGNGATGASGAGTWQASASPDAQAPSQRAGNSGSAATDQ